MQIHYQNHATEVVQRFKRMLDEEQIALIGEEHFDELETLISATMGSVASETIHAAAKRVEELATEFRKNSSKAQ